MSVSLSEDNDVEENMSPQGAEELERFNLAIEKVTEFVQNPEEKQLGTTSTTTMTKLQSASMNTPTEVSVSYQSYSEITDDATYIHGAAFSSPQAEFHENAIPDVIGIHDLLATHDQTLYFIADSDNESDGDNQVLNDEELSEERKQNELKISRINTFRKSIKQKLNLKTRKSKLKRSLSERGLTFAIRYVLLDAYILTHVHTQTLEP